MKILETVENSPCSKTMTIEVPVEEFQNEVSELYDELTAHAEIPGFRKGHAPVKLLKMRFEKGVQAEARQKIIEKACQDAIEEQSLRVVGEPKVLPVKEGEEQTEEEQSLDEPIQFKLEVEFIPEFDVTDYKDMDIEIPTFEVTDEQVDQVLQRQREQMAIVVPVEEEDKAIEKGDIATVDLEATCEGEPFPEAINTDYMMELGSGQHLPEFEQALMGKKAGDEVTVEVDMPESYTLEKYRGKKASFNIKIKKISQRQLPELDDEFAKDLDFDNLEKLKEKIRENLKARREMERENAIKTQVRNRLVEDNDIPAPQAMVDAEFRYINAMQNMELARMGTSFDALGDRKDVLMKENAEQAEQHVRTIMALEKIAEKEEINVSESDFFDYIENAAQAQGIDIDRFVSNIQKKGLQSYYQRQALEDKVLDFLVESANVKEKAPEKTENTDESSE